MENFRPGVMAGLGLGYDDLRERRPELIYCSITGFGSGAGAALPGYDLLVQAVGGLMSITGEADGPPQKVGVALVDVLCGLFASVGILVAAREREQSGLGQLIEVDLLSSLLAALVNQGSAYTLAGEIAARMGNAHPSDRPVRAVPDRGRRDRGRRRQRPPVRGALRGPGRARAGERRAIPHQRRSRGQPGGAARRSRGAAGGPARGRLGGRPHRRARPAGEVNDVGGAFALAESLGLQPIVDVPREDGTVARLTRNPVRLSRTPATYRSAPPQLGERS